MSPAGSRRTRRTALLALVVTVLLAGCSAGAPAEVTTAAPQAEDQGPRPVSTMAVVGDSMSVGMSACGRPDPCREASWAVGIQPEVDSIALRLAAQSGITPDVTLVARPGATVGDRVSAVADLDGESLDLVLVLIGANDACTSSMSAITPVAAFGDHYADLLAEIRTRAPDAAIVALSVPDLNRLWAVNRSDPRAVALWNSSPSCRSLLEDADSDAPSDQDRRAEIAATVDGYDAAIEDGCGAVAGCTYDDGAVHATVFGAPEVSTVDLFHPSASGQAALAASAWPTVLRALRGDAPR